MDIKYYYSILWRRKWIIIITFLVTMIVVIIGTLMTTPTYSATTTIRIAASSGSISNYSYLDKLMNTYVKLATTAPVLDDLQQQLGLVNLPLIEVKTVPGTELIQITVKHSDSNITALVANTLAEILINQSLELYTGSNESSLEILRKQLSSMEQEVNQARTDYEEIVAKTPDDATGIDAAKQILDIKQQIYASILKQYEEARLEEAGNVNMISIVDPAIPPDNPAKPKKVLNIALGFFVGMAGGLGLAFLFENLDNTLYTTDQIEKVTKLPTIGKIPRSKKQNSFGDLTKDFAFEESFRRLRTSILSVEVPIRSLLITSAEPREGKSRIVANLAYSMSQSGRDVVVIDCDLRLPSQDKLFHIDNSSGLSTTLEQKTGLREALQPTKFHGIHILPSGPLPPNPSELLGTEQMKIIIDQLTSIFDIVIIDAPAAQVFTDTSVLAPLVDAIAIVVSRAMASSNEVKALQTQLSKFDTKLIGVIINRAEQQNGHYYYNKKKNSKGNNNGSSL